MCNSGLEKVSSLFTNPYKNSLLVNKSLDLNLAQIIDVFTMYKNLINTSRVGVYWPKNNEVYTNCTTHAHIVLMNEEIIKEYNSILGWLLTSTPNHIYGNYTQLVSNNFEGYNMIQYRSGHIYINPSEYYNLVQQKKEYIKFLETHRKPIKLSLFNSIENQKNILEKIKNNG